MDIKMFIKNHQQKIVLVAGFVLVAIIGFYLGRLTAFEYDAPEVRVEQAFVSPNYSPNISGLQSNPEPSASNAQNNCEGKIKGSSSLIYHVPGGAFYDRTTKPIRCFDTESEAISAGFRKSTR